MNNNNLLCSITALQNVNSLGNCNSSLSSGPKCCSIENKCDLGQGDCDSDQECKDGLKCGINNCQKHFSLNGSAWNWYDDCCLGESAILLIPKILFVLICIEVISLTTQLFEVLYTRFKKSSSRVYQSEQ